MEELDLVVVGAGIYGLAVAKTYLQVNPSAKLLILEAASSVGGVWAEHRLYPGLKTNNMLGTYEFSDFPMDSEIFDIKPGQHMPGHVMHKYLTCYAERFDLVSRTRFETKVESAEHKWSGGWTLKTANGDELATKKLVLASGKTSDPFIPTFVGSETFAAPLFHMKYFLDHEDTLKSAQNVVVFGGAKSAWDAVYAYSSKGIHVDWIIRESGHGPAWMAPPYVTPLKKWLEKLVTTRLLTWLSPCIWGDADGYAGIRNFFHSTVVGRFIVDKFWGILGGDVIALNKYDSHPETKKLKPWIDPFFVANSLSILNYPTDFFDLVREGKVTVHIADITGLSRKTVHISNGTDLVTDALIVATGWKTRPPLTFLPTGIEASLGIPHTVSKDEISIISAQNDRADKEILKRFPRLKNQPKTRPKLELITHTKGVVESKTSTEDDLEPFKLYRFMVPPAFLETRDIAFAGSLLTLQTTLAAQTQALWIAAFFGPNPTISPLSHKSMQEIAYETLLHSRFGKWRYPGGYGDRFPDFVFDGIPYLDMLLGDLGLRVHRKGSALKEVLEPYGVEDYKGLAEEWLTLRGKGEQAGESESSDDGFERVLIDNSNAKAHIE